MTPADGLSSAAPVSREPTSVRRVLIVEDHADSRTTLQMVVEAWGHQVEVAEDGPSGIAKALSWQPDVAVVDIGLPGLNGYAVARQLRAAFQDRIFLVALTAYCQPQDCQQAFEAGFDAHMGKPANFHRLSRLLATPR